MAARGGSHGAQQSRGGGASRPRVAAEAWEGRSTRELGFEFVDLVIVVVCTDLKNWKVWKLISTGRYIKNQLSIGYPCI